MKPRGFTKNALTSMLIAMLIATGCSNSSAEPVGTTGSPATQQSTTAASPETTITKTDRPVVTAPDSFDRPEDEIIQRYLAFTEAVLVAGGEPEADPNYAPLFELVVEPQAGIEKRHLEKLKADGEIVVDPVPTKSTNSVKFVGAFRTEKTEGNTVVFLDCNVDATEVRTTEGEILNDEIATYVLAVEMKVVDGEWMVAAIDNKKKYEEVSTCDDYA